MGTPCAGSSEHLCLRCLCLQVVYEDGSCEAVWMGVERVRLLLSAGEELTPPSAASLQQLSDRWGVAWA
jgi:hypothetical protein